MEMTISETATAVAVAAERTINQNALIIEAFGYSLNLASLMIVLTILGIVWMFIRIQQSKRLDFADMLTKDGVKVSSTKVMQFIGGIAGTWVIIKTGINGTLSFEVFAVYLTYVASIEGFSKFISAKYNYDEISVADAQRKKRVPTETLEIDANVFEDAVMEIESATAESKQAVQSAGDAVKSAKKAQRKLEKGI